MFAAARSQDLEAHDCLIVCFLSHGRDGGHLFAYNCYFDEEELWKPFYGDNCKALVDKPKLFFIQVRLFASFRIESKILTQRASIQIISLHVIL